MKPSELFCFKDTKNFAAILFFLGHAIKNSSRQMRQISRRMEMIHPMIGWRRDEHKTQNMHTARGFSDLYHVFARKQCILCPALRHGCLKLSPVQTGATLLDVTCCVRLHTLLRVVGCCGVLLRKVWNRSNFSANNSQHFSSFRDRRSVAQQCWIRLHSSSNIVGATHAHYAWFTKTYGLYPSHDALQVPTLSGVVASVCTPLPTCTQQPPTFLAQQCGELLCPFARSLTLCYIDLTFFMPLEQSRTALLGCRLAASRLREAARWQ